MTGYRPHDHRWHKGLQMTWTHVSGENFWGGLFDFIEQYDAKWLFHDLSRETVRIVGTISYQTTDVFGPNILIKVNSDYPTLAAKIYLS